MRRGLRWSPILAVAGLADQRRREANPVPFIFIRQTRTHDILEIATGFAARGELATIAFVGREGQAELEAGELRSVIGDLGGVLRDAADIRGRQVGVDKKGRRAGDACGHDVEFVVAVDAAGCPRDAGCIDRHFLLRPGIVAQLKTAPARLDPDKRLVGVQAFRARIGGGVGFQLNRRAVGKAQVGLPGDVHMHFGIVAEALMTCAGLECAFLIAVACLEIDEPTDRHGRCLSRICAGGNGGDGGGGKQDAIEKGHKEYSKKE